MNARPIRPCLHKVANHQHGTNAAYVLDRCRCTPCTTASTDTSRARTRQQAYGRYEVYTDAAPVRAHVRELMAAGMGLKRIIEVSGVPSGTLWKLAYGKRNAAGDQAPSKRVTKVTAERILNTTVDLAGGALTDDTASAAARLKTRSLVALGWSMRGLAARLGVAAGNQRHLFHDTVRLTTRRVAQIEALFNDLSMTVPPQATHRQRQVLSRSRNYAAAHGWAPPLDLEDVSGVDLEDQAVDEIAVLRRLQGDRSVPLNRAERFAAVEQATAAGFSHNDIEKHVGISKPERYRSTQEAS